MTRKDLLADSILAASAITKNRFVGFDGAHCAAGKKALGVSKDDFEAGEMAAVEVYGIQVLETGGIFAAGDPITSDSTGRAVKAADFAVASAPTVDVSTALDIDVDTVLDIDVDTVLDIDVDTALDIDVTPTVDVSVPTGETPVTSTGAQPTLTISASASATGTATNTATGTATNTATGTATNTATGTATNTVNASVANSLSGGTLPVAINGYAKEASSGAGQFARVVLK